MPLFVLECEDCAKRFEVLERNKDEAPGRKCPKCEGTNTVPVIAAFGNYTISGNNSASTRPNKSRSTK
jgi:putative FmdB family regulatory protein